ncbi:MAG: CAP domain-containing protein [Synechococcus sp. SB0676_bin_10]|uniref:CAP domain-containing protein n=1 Tax=Synechococcus sp. SB0676_bin_10 TaxID=2604869 RepID=A0A6B1F7D8_9SYNE|nr:CAP domain-containing protein [Synechococcus sp. SB0664_bin_36]MYG37665.1 CAP domain-containing protein [Synechococcus sp. SB0676_bin_10]MYK07459.1 CAP domain-containing protein [Synechococcus sp. SB0670_bin_20]
MSDNHQGEGCGGILLLVWVLGTVGSIAVSIAPSMWSRIVNSGQDAFREVEEVFQPFLDDRDVSVNNTIECLHTTTSSSQGTPPPGPHHPTSPSISKLSSDELDQLRYHALRLINNDRITHGLPPVVLGTNPAAQLHAEDMLVNDYFGHWWADGRKPYMVYTQTGGTSYASENVATSGWTYGEWAANGCNTSYVRCEVPKPKEAITEHQWGMMYDDAHADWGHRDNILGKTHRAVNIGIGFNGMRTTFVQHFEGGAVQADGPPVLDQNGELCLSLSKRETGVAIGRFISIAYDPPPTPKTPTQIGALNRYCIGRGFTVHCPESSAARILEPPPPGQYYPTLTANEVVASRWIDSPSRFMVTARMGSLLKQPGVYTVIVWRDGGKEWLSEQLVALSLFVE